MEEKAHILADRTNGIRFSSALTIGLIPIVIFCVIALMKLINEGDYKYITIELSVVLALLFIFTIGFSRYTLTLFPHLSDLPFIWVVLLLLEFIIVPVHDILFDIYPFGCVWVYDDMVISVATCTLFVAGTWFGLFLSIKMRWVRIPPVNIQFEQPNVNISKFAFLIIVSMIIMGFSAQMLVLSKSMALSGDLAFSRGEGLMGVSIFRPIICLGNIATLICSRLSIVSLKKSLRVVFFRLGIMNMIIVMIVPILLNQRFGMLQAILYFIFPYISIGRWVTPKRTRVLYYILPILLTFMFLINTFTSVLRQLMMSGEDITIKNITLRYNNLGDNHFRHMSLLTEMIRKGADESNFGGLYSGTPLIGDILIIIPRILYPEKSITSMEVLNGIVAGRHFTALDRGSISVSTASLWVQFYLFWGVVGTFPLTFFYTIFSLKIWNWAIQNSKKLHFEIMSTGFWFIFGWLAYNVAFTSIELPGILLGALIAMLFINDRPITNSLRDIFQR